MKNFKLTKAALLFVSLIQGIAFAADKDFPPSLENLEPYELSVEEAKNPKTISEKVSFIGLDAYNALRFSIRTENEAKANTEKLKLLEEKVESFDPNSLSKKAEQSALNEASTRIEENTKALAKKANQSEINDINSKIIKTQQDLSKTKAELANKVSTQELAKKAEQSALDAANAQITKNQQALNETKAELANKVSTQELGKKADQSALDAANAQITKNQQALNETKAELANKVSTQELGKKADQSALDAANVQITKTQQNLSETKAELANKVSTQELAKKADKSALDAANLMIQRNQQAIALLAPANITKLHEQVQSNTARLNKLDKELQRGVATQAALSGLFQPYNVGKVNLTAAVGGYKSKSAVAVGMGYRVNEKFATKAGIAVSIGNSSSAAYNVGVNYEF